MNAIEQRPDKIDETYYIKSLEDRIDRLEHRSGLMSASWFTRVYTAWGYVIIGQLMLAVVFLLIGLFFGLLGG